MNLGIMPTAGKSLHFGNSYGLNTKDSTADKLVYDLTCVPKAQQSTMHISKTNDGILISEIGADGMKKSHKELHINGDSVIIRTTNKAGTEAILKATSDSNLLNKTGIKITQRLKRTLEKMSKKLK